jgi:hypothetical protein
MRFTVIGDKVLSIILTTAVAILRHDKTPALEHVWSNWALSISEMRYVEIVSDTAEIVDVMALIAWFSFVCQVSTEGNLCWRFDGLTGEEMGKINRHHLFSSNKRKCDWHYWEFHLEVFDRLVELE